jgi:thioredoxin-related protein
MQAYELKKIVEKYRDNVTVLSVCIVHGATVEDVASFNEVHGVSWLTGIDTMGNLLDAFEATGVPYLVLLDKDGNIVMRFKGLMSAETIEAHIDELISR